MLESRSSRRIYFIICVLVVIISIIVIFITSFSSETVAIGRWKLKHDRITGKVYRQSIKSDPNDWIEMDMTWEEAIYLVTRREQRRALEPITDELERLNEQNEELRQQLDEQKEQLEMQETERRMHDRE